jgi:hypothetical protein
MSVTLSHLMPKKNAPVWVELMPILNGDNDVCLVEDDNGIMYPYISADKASLQKDIDSMIDDWQQQIKDGERDDDDLYDGYVSLVSFDGQIMSVLDENTLEVISTVDWTIGRM